MPLTRILLEDANGKWVGEVEIGSPISRRTVVRSATFEEAIAQIVAAREAFLVTFGGRPTFSYPAEAPAPVVEPGPDEAKLLQDITNASVLADVDAALAVTDPVNESPKLKPGRHRATCDCPRCETKRAAANVEMEPAA